MPLNEILYVNFENERLLETETADMKYRINITGSNSEEAELDYNGISVSVLPMWKRLLA